MHGQQNVKYLYQFLVCVSVDWYVCATDDRDIIPVHVVVKNINYSVACLHPHSILFDLS